MKICGIDFIESPGVPDHAMLVNTGHEFVLVKLGTDHGKNQNTFAGQTANQNAVSEEAEEKRG